MDFLAYVAVAIFTTTVGTYLAMWLVRISARTGESPSREIDPYTGLPKAHAEPDALASIEDIYAGNADAGIADVYAGVSNSSTASWTRAARRIADVYAGVSPVVRQASRAPIPATAKPMSRAEKKAARKRKAKSARKAKWKRRMSEIDPYTGLPKAHAEPDALASIEDIYAGNADADIAGHGDGRRRAAGDARA